MFYKDVNTNNRKEMISFLQNHYRYYTMNPWNRNTSYANNVKIQNLNLHELSTEEIETAYDLLSTEEPNDYTDARDILFDEFRTKTGYDIGFNGRSGGYIVLYDTIPVANEKGIGYTNKRRTTCASIDANETFEDWEDSEIKERVLIIQEFDKLCDDLRNIFIETCKKYKVVDTPVRITINTKTLSRK